MRAKVERRQLQRTVVLPPHAPDAGVIGWTKGRGDKPNLPHFGRNASLTR